MYICTVYIYIHLYEKLKYYAILWSSVKHIYIYILVF